MHIGVLVLSCAVSTPFIEWEFTSDSMALSDISQLKSQCDHLPVELSTVSLSGAGYDGRGPALLTTGNPDVYPDATLNNLGVFDSLGVYGGPLGGSIGGSFFTGDWYVAGPDDQSASTSGSIPNYDSVFFNVNLGSDGVEATCVWLDRAAQFSFSVAREGDANRDGVFNTSDLLSVFKSNRFERGELTGLTDDERWRAGDWNNDLEFSSGDLITALSFGDYSAAASIVPEPRYGILWLPVLFWGLRR